MFAEGRGVSGGDSDDGDNGDDIYCRLFVERERRKVPVSEALPSHSSWPRREPGTCLPFC